MLIRFTLSNFYSFKNEVELNMSPSRERGHKEQVYRSKSRHTTNLLRGAIIYGSNASGKSNLVQALVYAKNLILEGKGANKGLDRKYFKLDRQSADKPSRFEFELQCNNTMYAYGFELFDKHIHEEWLYILKTNREEMVFERHNHNEDTIKFGKSIKALAKEEIQRFNFVAKGTRPNQLFLSESIDRNLDNFSSVYNWFQRTLKIISPTTTASGLEFRISEDSTFKDFLTQFLHSSDTGIKAINAVEISLNEVGGLPYDSIDRLTEDLEDEEAISIAEATTGKRIVFRKTAGEVTVYRLTTTHQCEESGKDITFELDEESDGTRRLIDLAPALYEMTYSKEGSVYVIDELDRSLHPHLTKFFMNSYFNSLKNSSSQLIVTTHESSLLDTKLIRRDEIWFIQKNRPGESSLYSLKNFKTRYDKDIRKDYLLGRYEAIPFVTNIQETMR